MNNTLIKGATIVNENTIFVGDVLIEGEIIKKIDENITPSNDMQIINAEGKYLIPGMIDDQVHFREPGLTQKANLTTESRAAAIAGGITTFMEMPNTVPQATLTQELLEDKYVLALPQKHQYANYSFLLWVRSNDNIRRGIKNQP